jgi:DNA-binding NtrC family response regulator
MSSPDRQKENSPIQAVLDWVQNESLQRDRGLHGGRLQELLRIVLDPVSALVHEVAGPTDLLALGRTLLLPMVDFFGPAQGVFFFGHPEQGSMMQLFAVDEEGREIRLPEPVSRTILASVCAGGEPIIGDALAEPEFARAGSVWRNQMRSILCVRAPAPDGHLGIFYLEAQEPGRFSNVAEPVRRLFESIATMTLENARLHNDRLRESARLRTSAPASDPTEQIIGSSRATTTLRAKAAVAAMLEQPVLLLGEQGSGRRLLARVIHEAGNRVGERFVACGCAAVPSAKLNTVLLGRAGAALRHALLPEAGLIARAGHGTLYLSDADRLGEELCRTLGRVAKSGTYRALGGSQDQHAHPRLILAAQPDPAAFRGRRKEADPLEANLQPLVIPIPPLRERSEDIPSLVFHFVQNLPLLAGRTDRPTFSPEALELLRREPWPGNVRELQQVVLRILVMHGGPRIEGPDVQGTLDATRTAQVIRGTAGPARGGTLWDMEQEMIRRTLRDTNGNMGQAARRLGIHRNTLTLKLKAMEGSGPAAS